MYIFQNALKNVVRNKGRNILIGIIIFAIITTTVITLGINNTANGIIDDYKTRFGSEVTITPDMQKIMKSGTSLTPRITIEQRKEFSQSKYIKEYKLTANAGISGENIKAVDEATGGGSGTTGMVGDKSEFINPTMQLIGNQFDDFQKGIREITDGKMPENDNECIVSKELAELNNLSVGDVIDVTASLFTDDIDVRNVIYTLTITGIYFDGTEEYGMFANPYLNRRNEVLTTFETITNVVQTDENGITVGSRYFLKDPDMLAAFTTELKAKGLNDIFKVTTDENSYNRVVGPVEGLRSVSITFMIIVLILGSIILILLTSIAIRERKYEIGVLRAMGMKKIKVALGLWVEMLTITAICLVIGIGIGSIIAQPVSNVLLEGQIENAQSDIEGGNVPGFVDMSSIGTSDEPISKLDISLGLHTTLQIIGISLMLATIAGLAAIIKITKYEPIKILMERN
ncbi:FtsX-like permease family protein [Alkalibaculum sp. M08DMB]|uniref:FtsX-like permease family protein n=1 Tax=Alkalibaculum sporogenes TaxID=2655001 RepID=A0A6A7K4A1_9FIRM|nr:FtsX-like permease family protein [Alkalibaculum sporogenes]MPW24269.1 FtsX-like permease family protein [Alkalibaculum sporogenes]